MVISIVSSSTFGEGLAGWLLTNPFRPNNKIKPVTHRIRILLLIFTPPSVSKIPKKGSKG
jgi:hypothetical protein